MSSITYRGKLLIIILIATAAYLFYISEQRKAFIKKYFTNPEVGDTYKMELDDEEGERYLHYLKIREVTPEGVVFILSRLKGKRSFDLTLKHFDTSETTFYTHNQVKEIVAKKRIIQNSPEIIEIIRKD